MQIKCGKGYGIYYVTITKEKHTQKQRKTKICIGNSMICSDIWHKYQEWYFKIVLHNFMSPQASEIWGNFEISRVVHIYAKYHVQFMLLLVYTTTWEIQSSNAMCFFSSSCFAS